MKKLEDKQREREWEEKRWQMQKDKELKERQAEERARQAELRRMEIDLEKQRLTHSQPHADTQEGDLRAEAPDVILKRFPRYNKEDDIEKFLISFERCCKDFEVSEDKWMLYLRPQISGKLLEIYSDMAEDTHRDYKIFKLQVQQKFQLTPEFYRLKFRTLKRDRHQSFAQVASKQAQYFDSWVRTSEVDSFLQLKELLKLEQLFHLVPSEYRWLIQDRNPKTANEAAVMIDQLITLKEGFRKEEEPKEKKPLKPTFYPHARTQMQRGGSGENTTYRKHEAVAGQARPEEKIKCYHCGRPGHLRYQCNLIKKDRSTFFVNRAPIEQEVEPEVKSRSPDARPKEKQCLFILSREVSEDYLESIVIDEIHTQGWRDTGSDVCIIRPEVVPQRYQHPSSEINLKGIGPSIPTPVVSLPIKYKGWEGLWDFAVCADIPYKCLIGNDLNGKVRNWQKEADKHEGNMEVHTPKAKCLTIQASSEQLPESSSSIIELVSGIEGKQEILREQLADETLQPLFLQAQSATGTEESKTPKFVLKEGVLYRKSTSHKTLNKPETRTQIVVPVNYRKQLLDVAHDNPQGGHLGVRKATQRISKNFFWPGMYQHIKEFCRSCNTCQRFSTGRDKTKAPLVPMPVVGEPFFRVGIDLVGPLYKPSRRGYKYILTVIDYATRYPDAVALTNIETSTIANALLSIWGRTGFPRELVSDLGTQFTSQLMKKLLELCGIKHLTSTPYHPQTNGLVENLNKTLVKMIKAYSQQRPHDWDTKLQQLLFAYRSVPQDSTGYSPFELLFGRKARGPLDLIREHWEASPTPDPVPVDDYIKDLQSTLKMARDIAQEHLMTAQEQQKIRYDATSRPRDFNVGDEVLFLTPNKNNKLQIDWTGPWRIVRKQNHVNCDILDERLGIEKRVHVNRIKPYVNRSANVYCIVSEEDTGPFSFWEGNREIHRNLDKVTINSDLSPSQQREVKGILAKYKVMFSDLPGRVQGVQHKICTGDAAPIASPPYRVTGKISECIEQEVREMLDLDIIVPSNSPWASPIVLVKKPDKTVRFCIDYRRLNKITQNDMYPMPRLDDLLERIGKAKFISSIDLTKGFWQVPMAPEDQSKTAFRTQGGLYEFVVLPFGLKNSPATFQRLVDKVLYGLGEFCLAYMDDIGIYSDCWEDHLKHLDCVLGRLLEAGLTIKASKCKLGNHTSKYLGHIIGGGCIRPDPTKVKDIHQWPILKTKKQIRSFLGLAGYYRKFIPSFSNLAAPLSDLTKKKHPNQVIWSSKCQESMDNLKRALTSDSVLKAPNFDNPFILTCDASDTGLGAVLSQIDEDGEDRPILFLSKKWHSNELSMSTIEKECYSIIWSIKKLKPYLWGRKFTLQTDHAPLRWLDNVKGTNNKLLRWSLSLQDFTFDIKHIKGKCNVVADALSRAP
uniref:Gypsy retrotransposon integrase-like protein 1 n=1 Tax=Anolis carolinensis TaxID=28377 RepID=A0A803TGK0_ANOCA